MRQCDQSAACGDDVSDACNNIPLTEVLCTYTYICFEPDRQEAGRGHNRTIVHRGYVFIE